MPTASPRGPEAKAKKKQTGSWGRPPFEAAPGEATLVVQKEPQRLAALLHEHRQLLSKIQQKKKECARLLERIESALFAGRREGLPMVEELRVLDQQLHSVFAQLLASRQQPRKTQKIVRAVYHYLQTCGQLSPAMSAEDLPDEQDPESQSGAGGDAGDAEDELPPEATGGTTAKRTSEQSGGPSLRGLFHRLAEALHPDKVQDPQQKAERTELMKDLTQAYHAGDLARLIELERTWLLAADLGQDAAAGDALHGDELERRCGRLEATNRALRSQLDAVKKELRTLRRSPQAGFLAEMRSLARGSKRDPVEVWLDILREQRADLRELLALVVSYRDGEIDIYELQRGVAAA